MIFYFPLSFPPFLSPHPPPPLPLHHTQYGRLILQGKETISASRIQALWRGFDTRRTRKKNTAAVSLQRVWRGAKARSMFDDMIAQQLDELEELEAHEDQAATVIQSIFRGYEVRHGHVLGEEENGSRGNGGGGGGAETGVRGVLEASEAAAAEG